MLHEANKKRIREKRSANCFTANARSLKSVGGDMGTGTDVQIAGIYVPGCCEYETTFLEDQTFTRCPRCSALTRWEPVDADEALAA